MSLAINLERRRLLLYHYKWSEMKETHSYRVFLADDHQLFADGMIRILQDEPDFLIEGIYNTGEAVLHALNGTIPDIVILDIHMPGITGINTCYEIKRRYPQCKVLLLSMFDLPKIMQEITDAGANGFIPKTSDADLVKATIRSILQGEDIFIKSDREPLSPASDLPHLHLLSTREKQIISLIKEGNTSRKIAEILNLSPYTIETHRKNIFKKLQFTSMSELIAFAYDNGL